MASQPKDKTWTRLVPFTRSWHDRRNARKQDADSGIAAPPDPSAADTDASADNATGEGEGNNTVGEPAEIAGLAAAKWQQMDSPILTPFANGLSNPKAEDLDRSGGAREVIQNEVSAFQPPSSTSPTQITPPFQQTTPPPAPALAPQPRAATAPQTRTTTAPEPRTATKSLAQYGIHDNKGAVGWVAPTPSPYRLYPIRQHVNGHHVVAQYGHNTDKWAVKHPVY